MLWVAENVVELIRVPRGAGSGVHGCICSNSGPSDLQLLTFVVPYRRDRSVPRGNANSVVGIADLCNPITRSANFHHQTGTLHQINTCALRFECNNASRCADAGNHETDGRITRGHLSSSV